jgi:hypothetical protein
VTPSLHALIPGILLWFLLPLWFLAGVADYLVHRRTRIEDTSGIGESRLHVLQAIEIGIPLLAGLFLEINSGILAAMILFVVAHTATALWDTSYSNPRRYISAFEQHVHSHLEYIPIMAVTLVVALHWDAFLALFDAGTSNPAFDIKLKSNPIPLPYLLAVLVPVFVQSLLLTEETLRSARGQRIPPT